MDLYLDLIRPVLFRTSAENAHRLSQLALRWSLLWQFFGAGPDHGPRLTVRLHGLGLPNPVGLAPGFDKDCDVLASLMHLGFGYLAPGAILRDVRPGNPRPRLGRIVEQQATINCMGLPSKGQAHAVRGLRRLRNHRVPVIPEVHGFSREEILDNLAAVQPHAEGLQLSMSCPNARDDNLADEVEAVVEIVQAVARVRRLPIFFKVPHNFLLAERELALILDACVAAGIEGVIASATRRHKTDQLSVEVVSLAGKPIFQDTLALVRRMAALGRGRLTIVASGGVFTGNDAYEMLSAGASLVEIYSAIVYRGWMAPALINRELIQVLDAKGIESIQSLVDSRIPRERLEAPVK